MISKSISEITPSDFQNLIDNEVPESKTIEYKQTLNLKTDSDRKEFLADVSSFANTSGGDLIYGIAENEKKLPYKFENIDIKNFDEIKLQIDSLIRDGIVPRINGIQMKEFKMTEAKLILLIRIPKSWNSPHQVVLKGSNKFYARASNGKYLMDIHDLKSAFLLSDTIAQKIREFIAERVLHIASGDSPLPLLPYGKIVLHLVPLSSFNIPPPDILKFKSIITKIRALNGGSRSPRYNLDGLIISSMASIEKGCDSYLQLFRNGIIETVNSELLYPYNENNLQIPVSDSINYEYSIIEILHEYMEFYKKLDVGLPIFLFLSLIDIKGYKIFPPNYRSSFNPPTGINKNVITLPEVTISNLNDDLPHLLKPLFDIIWNSCGLERSLNYVESGKWKFSK
jgi:hypothetical protein